MEKGTISGIGAAALLGLTMLVSPAASPAVEVRIGRPQEAHGVRIAASYSAPVSMDEYWGGPPPEEADIHLEADVHATRKNRHGFRPGDWIPYLSITYTLERLGTGTMLSGQLWQMVARDGPHYGLNLRLPGPGRYRLTYRIGSPAEWGLSRHTDPVTGVDPWWEPFEVEWTFQYPAAEKRR
jgi:hypothetical protein